MSIVHESDLLTVQCHIGVSHSHFYATNMFFKTKNVGDACFLREMI